MIPYLTTCMFWSTVGFLLGCLLGYVYRAWRH